MDCPERGGVESSVSPVAPAVGAGGEGALRAAMAEAAGFVRRYLFGLCGDWHRADDLAQEAMLKAWARRESFVGHSDARTWLFAIARNHWLDALRRKKAAAVMETMPDMTADTMAGDGRDEPSRVAAAGELRLAVERALSQLPPEQREALALRESDGLSFAQIAEVTQTPLATVKSRVRYGLLKLAELLRDFRDFRESGDAP